MLGVCVGLACSASLSGTENTISMEDDNPFNLPLELMKPVTEKEPCCMPTQWEALYAETIKIEKGPHDADEYHMERPHPRPRPARMIRILGRMSVDSPAKKVAMQMEMAQKEGPSNLTIIINYANKTMYVADLTKKVCHKSRVEDDMAEQCLPKDAKYLGTVRFGSGSTNSMEVDAWAAVIEQKSPAPMKIGLHVLVTPDLCVPVMEAGGGVSMGYRIGLEASFMNFNTSISDPDVFTPPSFCDEAEEVSAHALEPMVAVLKGRFSKH